MPPCATGIYCGAVAMEQFELIDDDRYAVEIAKNTARRFLKDPRITPQQIIGIGKALHALERLPLVTRDIVNSCVWDFFQRIIVLHN